MNQTSHLFNIKALLRHKPLTHLNRLGFCVMPGKLIFRQHTGEKFEWWLVSYETEYPEKIRTIKRKPRPRRAA